MEIKAFQNSYSIAGKDRKTKEKIAKQIATKSSQPSVSTPTPEIEPKKRSREEMEKEDRKKKHSDNSNTRKSMENEMMEAVHRFKNEEYFDENEKRAESISTVDDDEELESLVVVVQVLYQSPFHRYCNYLLLVLNCLNHSQILCHGGQLLKLCK